jgi:tetratricopeptide (TPR) repeat protein
MSFFGRLFGISKGPGALLSKAREAERNDNPEEALNLYNQIIDRFPNSPQAQQARIDAQEITSKPTGQVFDGHQEQATPIESQPREAEGAAAKAGAGSWLQYLDNSQGTKDLYELLRSRSTSEIDEICRKFPIAALRLDYESVQQDFLNYKRFEVITTLAEILLAYRDLLEKRKDLRLPVSLPAWELSDALMVRLMPFIRDLENIEVAEGLRVRLYDFAMVLLQQFRDSDALTCLLVSRPSLKNDHDFWICACRYNIARMSYARKDIDAAENVAAAIEDAERIVDGTVQLPISCVDGAKQFLDELRRY